MSAIRRITIYRDKSGQFRYYAQARNWRKVAVAEEGFTRKATVLRRIEKSYPGVEVIDNT